jgi:diphthine-ammonia ligase
MKLGVLFSGGKDSCFAMSKAMKNHEIACLITMVSENKESFMFHVPNIFLSKMQSQAMEIPLLSFSTKGKKEEELEDLKKAILEAKEKYSIEGIVTGAVRSEYQASRIEKICKDLGLSCINPLWHMDEINLLEELVEIGITAIISGVFAYPLSEDFLGKKIDKAMIERLGEMKEKYKINPAGEGGEIETTVIDAPFFKKRIEIMDSDAEFENYSGVFIIKLARLAEK